MLVMAGLAALGFTVSCRHFESGGAAGSDEALWSAEAAADARAERRQRLTAELLEKEAELPIDKELTSRQALVEVDERLVLPESYGRTVVITGDNEPIVLPKGPMEELVNRRVTMQLRNADVVALAEALSEVDGLNIIRDDSLTGDKTATILVKDVPLHELLNYAARNMGIAFHVGDNAIWVTEAESQPSGPSLETRIFRLRRGLIPAGGGAAAGGGGGGDGEGLTFTGSSLGSAGEEDTELEDALEQVLADSPQEASYKIYRNRNLLVVRNSREKLRLVEQIVRDLDRIPPQVLIEARFVSLSHRDFFELGVDVNELLIDTGSKLEVDASSLFPVTEASDALGGKLGLSGILGNTTYDVVLRALRQLDDTRTLSLPRVTVLNNHSASIFDGRRTYYYEDYDLESIDRGDGGTEERLVPTGEPAELEFGLSLGVTVSIGHDGETVLLALAPRLRSPDGDGFEEFAVGESGNVRLPKYFESSVSTTVVVKSGQTVVLGGTMKTNESQIEKKTPFFGDLPLVGYLFRHTTEDTSPQHLLIFVTATIISPSGEFVQTVEAVPGVPVQ